MPDFTAPREAQTSGLTNTVRWEVVMQHEPLLFNSTGNRVESLRVGLRSQRQCPQRLGFSPVEYRGPVRPRKKAHLGCKRSELVESSAVDTSSLLKNVRANNLMSKEAHKLWTNN